MATEQDNGRMDGRPLVTVSRRYAGDNDNGWSGRSGGRRTLSWLGH